ncbi:ADP-ribose pyrophosphatase [Haloarcula argentinensis DSM 12282]|nr:ADP-ribose pyrophosphatase [Haloarcula argentinensis DSM 12282]
MGSAFIGGPQAEDMDIHDERIPTATFATCLDNMPQPCVDLVVEYEGGVVLTRRQNEPAKGEWFWPGSRLFKGERLDDAAPRIAEAELGLTSVETERLGVSEHFWDTSSVDGVDSRHTIPIVYRVVPDDGEEMTLDDQHDAYQVVTEPPADANRYVSEYFDRFDIGQ